MTSALVSNLGEIELAARLKAEGVILKFPPFSAQISSPIPIVAQGIVATYANYALTRPCATEFADFHVRIAYGRRFPRPQCSFESDGVVPFSPLPAGEAYALLEWGINWCVTSFCHTWVTIHSAVLERHGRVLVMPAPPGSGKSTLCAALALNGWRLLSDEMALLDPLTGLVTPSPRPISLKNHSIEIIRQLSPTVVIGPVAFDTKKGHVAHMRPPTDSNERALEPALPAWIVFPRFVRDAPAQLVARGKATSFMQLAENSFNQSVHGRTGFEALSAMVDRCDCYDFSYGQLVDAIEIFSNLPLPG